MGLPKRCFCCFEPVRKNNLKRKLMKSNDEKVLNVSLVRLENDTKVESYIKENNIKTDFKIFMCSSPNRNCLNSVQKGKNKNSGNQSSDCSKLKNQEVSTVNNMSCNFTAVDYCPALRIKRFDGIESTNAICDLIPGGSVPVVRLENYIEEKVNICSTAKSSVNYFSKKVYRNSGNHYTDFSNCSKLKLLDNSNTDDVSYEFVGFNGFPSLNIEKSDSIDSSNTISDLGPIRSDILTTDNTSAVDKKNDVSSDSLVEEVKVSDRKKSKPCPASRKKIKPCPASRRKGKVEVKTCQPIEHQSSFNLISEVNVPHEDKKITPLKKDCNDDNVSVKIGLKQKISPDIEEPLSLITKLTGCQIPPSKVKVLPLTSCISSLNNSDNDSNTELSKNNYKLSEKDHSLGTHTINGISSYSNEAKNLIEKKNKCKDGNNVNSSNPEKIESSPEKIERSEDDIRTVYDVMEYISIVLPSWNLHILPDTNTFCICQVTRSKLGVPNISKCIELDVHFNGKVYIYEQHCKRFDGVYDSEDAVVALIKEVDEIL